VVSGLSVGLLRIGRLVLVKRVSVLSYSSWNVGARKARP
jgi:hypothetical protein